MENFELKFSFYLGLVVIPIVIIVPFVIKPVEPWNLYLSPIIQVGSVVMIVLYAAITYLHFKINRPRSFKYVLKIDSYFKERNIEVSKINMTEKNKNGKPVSFEVDTNDGIYDVSFLGNKISATTINNNTG